MIRANGLQTLIVGTVLVVLSASAQAGTVTVCATGCDYTSISAAVAGASSGDTIRLLDAIHTEANIDIDKALTIQGQGMANTTVQAASTPGTGIGSVFTINGHASPFLDNLKPGAATIQDMTIRHGSAGLGGALYSFYGSFTLNRVRLLHNASSQGGAIWNFKSGLTIHDSIISGNVADNVGGGIFNYLGFLIITGSTISGNAASFGGGIYTFGGLRVTNSTFSGNSATVGGGILHQATVIHVSSSTFVDNSASEGGGIWNSGCVRLSRIRLSRTLRHRTVSTSNSPVSMRAAPTSTQMGRVARRLAAAISRRSRGRN